MKLSLALPVALLLSLASTSLASAQRALHANDGDRSYKEHGHTLAAAGDVDGDGAADYWVGAPDLFDSWPSGSVYLVSGADGATLRQLDGEDALERFGYALAAGADLTGDGVPDVAVGAPRAGAKRRGAVRVYSGADGASIRQIIGRAADERFGEALALLGDLDGDGVPELAVGAPGDDRAGADAGSVRVHSGATGALLATRFGAAAGEELGLVLADAGDFDGDGKGELLLGVPRAGLGGEARLVSGASGATLRTLSGDAAGDDFGRALAGSDDLDGDGARDLVVGAPGGRYARAFSGASGAVLWTATRTRPEQHAFHYAMLPEPARFGWSVCAAGDQDRDGVADVAVGYPESSSVWLLSGADGSTLEVFAAASSAASTGESLFAYLGFALASLGDLDGDGDRELAAGAPTFAFPNGGADDYTGRVVVLDGGLRADLVEGTSSDALGVAVAGAGDVDGDGRGDIAHSALAGGIPLVRVVSGRDRSVLREWSGAGGSGFGRALAPAGDVDLDGVTDLVVGASADAEGGALAGRVSVYSGASGAELHRVLGAAGDHLGTSVAGVGDVNGDGRADFAAGAPRVGGDVVLTGFCTSGAPPAPGYARVYSGADGSVLVHVDGVAPTTPYCEFGGHAGEIFGFALTGAGDWDGDGTPDFAVGAPAAQETWGGAVRVFSGAGGALLSELLGGGVQSEFGVSVAGGPDFDVDGDGRVDLVVGEQEIYYGFPVSGAVYVFSSADESRLLAASAGTPPVSGPNPRYGGAVGPGYAVALAGDFDGDGRSDFAVANPAAPSALGQAAGEVRVLSGADASVLARLSGTSSWDYLGYSVALAGDVNGDGRADVVAGAPTSAGSNPPNARSRVRVLHAKGFRAAGGPGTAVSGD